STRRTYLSATVFMAPAARSLPLGIRKPQRSTTNNIGRIEESFTRETMKTTKKNKSGSQEPRNGISEIEDKTARGSNEGATIATAFQNRKSFNFTSENAEIVEDLHIIFAVSVTSGSLGAGAPGGQNTN